MSTNGQLVFTDVDKITFKGVGNASNAVIDTLTGKIGVGVDSPDANLHVVGNSYVSTNLELGGTLIMGTVNVESQHSLEAVTATGNTTPLTIEFTNPTTSLVASGNVEVGGDVVLSGNIYNNANLSVQYTTIFPTWTQVGQDIDGEAAGDSSGWSVSMSSDGTRVAIGAIRNDGTASEAGHVRVYEWNSGTSLWTQVGQDIDGEAAGDNDWSGFSVSISSDGTRVAIGAVRNDGTAGDAGHVRVYSESGGTWTQVGSDIDGEAASDQSGYSVSISSDGTRVAIGAYGNDGNGSDAGHVRVYEESGGTWTQVGSDIDGEAAGDMLGTSVSMSSDGARVAIGADSNDDNGSSAGHVRVYAESSGTWTQVGSDIDGEAADDYSGWSVSMSSDGTRVAIGAYGNDGTGTDAGHVRVYAESSGTWTQVGNDIDGEAAGDESGWSVSMSSDGTRVAIGARGNDGTGHVRVYSESGGTWTQVGSDIDGEAAGDQSGAFVPVSMSSDGTRVAIGAPRNDGTGTDAGHVRVYDWAGRSKKILKENIVEVSGELTVSGNVEVAGNVVAGYLYGDGSNISGISSNLDQIVNIGNVTSNTVQFSNAITSLTAASNVVVTGNVTADHFVGDGSNITGISSTLQAITDSGPGANVTSNTVQFTNATTGLVTTSNVEVGGEFTVTGNVVVDTNTLFVDSVNNRVGVGTTIPGYQLDLQNIASAQMRIKSNATSGDGDATLIIDSSQIGESDIDFMHDGVLNWRLRTGDASGTNFQIHDQNDGSVFAIKQDGRVGIGTTTPDAVLDVRSGTEIPRLRGDAGRSLFMGSNYTHVNSTGFSETSTNYAWGGYPGVVRMNSGGEWRVHGETGTYTVLVRADGGFGTFTGSHDTFTPFSEDDVGKIVYSTGNYATEVKDGNVNGVIYDYLTIMDSCPVVKICATENDKRVMGVLSTRHLRTQIKEITKEEYELNTGDEKYAYEKKEGAEVYIRDIDTDEFSRGYYNAVGEGGIWVCNKNGNLENGDYITSSTVAGYGQKQNDDLLHNYTVAKITADCDFSEIWVTTKKHKKTREGYLFDENKEPVYENILDAGGNTRTHLKFKIRYLLPDGTQISEEEYTTRASMDEKVYIAAFVGCTYHCG